MTRIASTLQYKNIAQSGFTLIELITVIAVVSILAIVVVPRFFGNSGFSEYAYQQQFTAAMRNIQIKAIYDTRDNFCYKMILNTSANPQYGASSDSYLAGDEASSCGNTIDANSPDYLRSDSSELNQASISISALDAGNVISFIQFDNLGRPITSSGTCSATCRINFIGEDTLSVCIEPQGYIYACS
ncbi:pilus assembly FimT family protein [Glaciecola petra]|uniref:Type II secretion system protein n=1 Tax=Glaciecola petra TaxID=3075602 RepID=A0ABU2ZSN4_9ALTE|nr:type II secretion system protein [Aestuariibacter sp. P117]MDT0595648.1 type II secretion system protein [Aestuariibacter sp. P117]